MIATIVESKIRGLMCGEIEVVQKGVDRFAIHTPFEFGDGDSYVSVLKKEGGDWFVCDEGHTFMHMSYSNVDFLTGSRLKLIDEALGRYGLDNRGGILRLRVPEEDQIGHAVFSFVQAISQVTNVTQFTRDVARSTFMDDFRAFIASVCRDVTPNFDWHDPEKDQDALYSVDCRILTPDRPWMVFAIGSSDKCKNATITCLKMESMIPNARSIAIFENQSEINSKDVARLTDIVFKPYSSLADRDRIAKYFDEVVFGSQVHSEPIS